MASDYTCSFCGAKQANVRILIAAANGIFICENCVALCAEIVAEQLPFDGVYGARCDNDAGGVLCEIRNLMGDDRGTPSREALYVAGPRPCDHVGECGCPTLADL